MNALGHLTLLIWLPIVVFLYRWLPPRRAIIIAFIFAFLFLPQYAYRLPIFPNYGRMSATCYAIVLSIILFDIDRLKKYQPSWMDLPILIFCLSPFASSVSNDLGMRDGIIAVLEHLTTWGAPYFIGRLYFSTLTGLRQLAVGIFMGGLAYVPLCFWEVRMSPRLHRDIYGFSVQGWAQAIRYGGFRPVVFLDHGLQLGLWMMAAALIGFWLWQTGTIKKILGIPIQLLVALQVVAVIIVKSTGAWLLLGIGTLTLMLTKYVRLGILIWMLVLLVPPYLYFSASGDFNSDNLVAFIEDINVDRAQSLEFRFNNELPLSEKARERFLFGWGGWGRSLIYSENDGSQTSTADSRWIIIFGTKGLIGLVSYYASLLIPTILFFVQYSAAKWDHKRLAPAVALIMVIILSTIDSLLNDMGSPIYTMACGGITGLLIEKENRVDGIAYSQTSDYS